jgi:hypothetical protein
VHRLAAISVADVHVPPRRGRPDRLLAFLLYGGVSIFYFGLPILSRPGSRYVGLGPGGDAEAYMWFLRWWPHAIRHGLNPLVTHVIWAPIGTNLAWTASMPGVAVPAAPLTTLAGPVIAYNVLAVIAPALSAWAAFLLCRHLAGGAFWGPLAGGYVFGFSSFELSRMLGHLNFLFTFLIPLCVYLVLLQLQRRIGPRRFVVLLTAGLALMFLIVQEFVVTLFVFGAAVVLLGWAIAPAQRQAIRRMARLTMIAFGAATILLSPYLYFLFGVGSRPELKYVGSPSTYSSDLLSFIIPTRLAALNFASSVSSKFTAGPVESGAYLGIPLIAVAVHYYVRHRREPLPRVLIWTLAIICFASLGPWLHVAGTKILPLPLRATYVFPLAGGFLPARFAVYLGLVAGVMLTLWATDGGVDRRVRIVGTLVIVASLAPNIASPYWKRGAFWDSPVPLAPFFQNGQYKDTLQPGVNVLRLPYAFNGTMMLEQANADMYYRLAGGYVSAAIPPPFLEFPVFPTLVSGTRSPTTSEDIRAFVCATGVGAILISPSGSEPWSELIGQSMQMKPKTVGGVSIFPVPPSWQVTCAAR